jgi:hypothetical protein
VELDFGDAVPTAMGFDTFDNLWVAGSFRNSMRVAKAQRDGFGESDAFVASFAASGSARFLRVFGDAGSEHVAALATDQSGAYAAGLFEYRVPFQPEAPLQSEHETAGFVLRLDGDGTPRWSRAITGQSGTVLGIAGLLLLKERLVVAGTFSGQVKAGRHALRTTGTQSSFVAGYSRAGEVVWALSIGNQGEDRAESVAPLQDGALVLVRHIERYGYVNPENGAFLIRVDAAGKLTGKQKVGRGISPTAIATDPSGSIYLVGSCDGSIAFPGKPCLAKQREDGAQVWIRVIEDPPTVDEPYERYSFPFLSVSANARGIVARARSADHDANVMVAMFNPHGKLVWRRDLPGTGYRAPILLRPNGHVILEDRTNAGSRVWELE